jgi:ribosomal protein S18 acetylase RimI-like enzyme
MTQAALDADAESLTGAVRLYERAGMHIHKRREVYEKAV